MLSIFLLCSLFSFCQDKQNQKVTVTLSEQQLVYYLRSLSRTLSAALTERRGRHERDIEDEGNEERNTLRAHVALSNDRRFVTPSPPLFSLCSSSLLSPAAADYLHMADVFLDLDSRRCTPGFLRNALTTWHQGEAAPKQRPPYYYGVPDTRLRAHRTTGGGRMQPTFSLTLTQEEADGEEGDAAESCCFFIIVVFVACPVCVHTHVRCSPVTSTYLRYLVHCITSSETSASHRIDVNVLLSTSSAVLST